MALQTPQSPRALALGSPAPGFELVGVDDRRHALDDYEEAPALVLIQSCNHCPYVIAWEGRMNAIQRDYDAHGVRLVAVNSNDPEKYPADSFEEMKKRAAERGFGFDYLWDPDQALARALGSTRTPEVFLFDRERKLVYHGAIDDHRDEGAVTRHWLREALDATLAGEQPSEAETAPVGCSVKYRG